MDRTAHSDCGIVVVGVEVVVDVVVLSGGVVVVASTVEVVDIAANVVDVEDASLSALDWQPVATTAAAANSTMGRRIFIGSRCYAG